jgi:hypothetical protein
MKIFLEGGKGNGEYIEQDIENPFLLKYRRIIVPDGSYQKIEYEMAEPFRLRNGAIVFVESEIEIPQERLDILEPYDYFTGITRRIEYWGKKRKDILFS